MTPRFSLPAKSLSYISLPRSINLLVWFPLHLSFASSSSVPLSDSWQLLRHRGIGKTPYISCHNYCHHLVHSQSIHLRSDSCHLLPCQGKPKTGHSIKPRAPPPLHPSQPPAPPLVQHVIFWPLALHQLKSESGIKGSSQLLPGVALPLSSFFFFIHVVSESTFTNVGSLHTERFPRPQMRAGKFSTVNFTIVEQKNYKTSQLTMKHPMIWLEPFHFGFLTRKKRVCEYGPWLLFLYSCLRRDLKNYR